jgi:hypothetical protein
MNRRRPEHGLERPTGKIQKGCRAREGSRVTRGYASGEVVQEEDHVLKINHAHVGIEQASERGSWG